MNYCLAKLKFTTPIHSSFGDLADTQNIFLADTIFSALCIEALNYDGEGKLNELVHLAGKNDVKISDAFPFLDDDYYLPKPVMAIEHSSSEEYDVKKQFKKLKYISVGMWHDYLKGNVDAKCENDILKEVGKSSVKVSVAKKGLDETMPYAIGNYSFSPNAGLYFILGFKSDKELALLKELVISLSSTGIGGKKSSGYGKFMADFLELPDELNELINLECDKYMSLTTCMMEDELIEELLPNSTYSLVKRAGYIYSENFAETFRKKRDIFAFSSGSCFPKKFNGIIIDVADGRGKHPVYKYLKPIFVGVK